jgi:hypothetical protein
LIFKHLCRRKRAHPIPQGASPRTRATRAARRKQRDRICIAAQQNAGKTAQGIPKAAPKGAEQGDLPLKRFVLWSAAAMPQNIEATSPSLSRVARNES